MTDPAPAPPVNTQGTRSDLVAGYVTEVADHGFSLSTGEDRKSVV